jgi:hypothetical protein
MMREDANMNTKRLLLAEIILTLMAIFFCPPAWAQKMREPKLVLKQTVFDFNEVTEGSTISHSFSVINNGNETLKILRVKPG